MKVKAPSLMKKIIEALSSKTNELRIRIMIFFLLHKNLDNKSSLTNSLHALVSHHHHHHQGRHHKKKNDDVLQDEQQQQQQSHGHSLMMNYNNKATTMHVMVNNTIHDDDMTNNVVVDDDNTNVHDDDDVHDDDVHDDDDGEKKPRVDLEDIDQAADLFIERFKKQMILQKQRSLERQNWLLLSN